MKLASTLVIGSLTHRGAASTLALEVAKKWRPIDWDVVRHTLERIVGSLPPIEQPDAGILRNVKHVLEWNQVLKVLENSKVGVEASLSFGLLIKYANLTG